MLVIRLSRTGRKKQPTYRVVVAEHSAPVKGRFIEVLGHYNPRTKDLVIDNDRATLRLNNGAQPSNTAEALLEKAGVLKRDKIIRRPERAKRKTVEEAPAAAASAPAEKSDDTPAAETAPTDSESSDNAEPAEPTDATEAPAEATETPEETAETPAEPDAKPAAEANSKDAAKDSPEEPTDKK